MNDTFDLFGMEENAPETDSFKIETAEQADWAIEKILEAKERYKLYKEAAKAKIERIKEQVKEIEITTDNSTTGLKDLLMRWAETQPLKKAKASASLMLPSGKLTVKYGHDEFDPNRKALAEHYANTAYSKVTVDIDWEELKKDLIISDGVIINTKTGEIISDDLIKVIDVPPEIEVK